MAKLSLNISYLTLSQMANYLFPLITIPYITRVIGPSNYGLVEFAAVVLLYFVVIVDYSFHTTATRRIAVSPHKSENVSFIFSTVMGAKMILFGGALLIFTVLLYSVGTFRENLYLLWLSFPIILGWAIYPNFLFYGIQKLGIIAVANVLTKGMAALLIFTFINEEGDFYYINFINGATQVIIGIITFVYAFKIIPGLRWISPKWRPIKIMLLEGRFILMSNFFTRIYGFSSIFIGGFLLTPVQLGIFAAAAKLINVVQSFLFQPLHGALFPYLSQKFAVSTENFKKYHKRSMFLLSGVTLIATLALIFLGPYAVDLIFGKEYSPAAKLVTIMAPMLVIGGFGHMHLQQGLLVLRKDKAYMAIVVTTGLLSIILNLWLIPLYSIKGAAYVRLITELLIATFAILMYYPKVKNI